ncbi:hypothetical protein [Polaribacter sargassicola]|uniref:hypothetical protein n=1 Tax=Polaribacter sargassicola TaxID=2836891 RepID=UPI001F1E501B|nr:hypothetical protein [Polaribacter sp. DS7-9]MCG1035055.1 hypothetical protein [Polaribacter sp. DS7-9]
MLNQKIYKNRKKLVLIGFLLTFFGALLAYLKWGIEPEETIAGFLCGIGASLILFSFGLKKTKDV